MASAWAFVNTPGMGFSRQLSHTAFCCWSFFVLFLIPNFKKKLNSNNNRKKKNRVLWRESLLVWPSAVLLWPPACRECWCVDCHAQTPLVTTSWPLLLRGTVPTRYRVPHHTVTPSHLPFPTPIPSVLLHV